MPSVFRISGSYQTYDWGKRGSSSQVAQLASATDVAGKPVEVQSDKPYAELWMGTHPSGPSHIVPNATLLKSVLDENKQLLGDRIESQYHDLPYLLKVLSIAKALSIQAHPDKTLAKELHQKFPQHYKDDNHKPEMAIALTDFEAFCGFKPLEEIVACLESVPEFATVAGKAVSDEFIATVKAKKDVGTNKAALKKLLHAVMTADAALVKQQLATLVARFSANGNLTKGSLEELVVRLDSQYPGGDIGCFTMMLLNYVQLKSGEAMFLRANMPHAYLSGDCVECMAASDNVVRAGLTPKYQDVETLVRMLTYDYGPAEEQKLLGDAYKNTKHSRLYDPPIEEFSILKTSLAVGESEQVPAIAGPSILIVTEGDGVVSWSQDGTDSIINVAKGHILFIGAGCPVTLSSNSTFTGYRAYCEI